MILALLAVAGLAVPLITTNGGAPERLQVAHSAWMKSVVWNAQAAPLDSPLSSVTLSDLQRRATTPEAAAAAAQTDAPVPEAVVTPVPTPTPEPWGTMEVREGDTLFDLALWFGIHAGDIASVNGMDVGDYVVTGEVLVIPVPESEMVLPPEPQIVAVVEPEVEVFEEPAPEPEPVETAPPVRTPAAPVFAGTADDVIDAICSLPWDCEKMVRIAMCESGLVPHAYNPAGYYGLFQINYEFPGWDDPYINAQVAYEQKYLPALQNGGNGLSPWPHCQHY